MILVEKILYLVALGRVRLIVPGFAIFAHPVLVTLEPTGSGRAPFPLTSTVHRGVTHLSCSS